jgi:hypothetical protein
MRKLVPIVLIIGALLITAAPPYDVLLGEHQKGFIGYHFFAPHLGKTPATAYQYFQVDLVRVVMEWACLLAVIAALWLLTKREG